MGNGNCNHVELDVDPNGVMLSLIIVESCLLIPFQLFLIGLICWIAIRERRERRRRQRQREGVERDILQTSIYSKGLGGDETCAIYQIDYEVWEKIILLLCNEFFF